MPNCPTFPAVWGSLRGRRSGVLGGTAAASDNVFAALDGDHGKSEAHRYIRLGPAIGGSRRGDRHCGVLHGDAAHIASIRQTSKARRTNFTLASALTEGQCTSGDCGHHGVAAIPYSEVRVSFGGWVGLS